MKKKQPPVVNDIIAIVLLILIIPGIWILHGLEAIFLPGEIIGATIVSWSLILQYYFRKSKSEKTKGGT